jgi:hypothetical protein
MLAPTPGLPPGDPTTQVAAIPLMRSRRPSARRFGSLKTFAVYSAVSVALFAIASALDPDLVPAGSLAGRIERVWAGAVGRRATSFATSGPPPTPVPLPAPELLPVVEAGAPAPVTVPLPPRAAASVAIRTSPPVAIPPRPHAPVMPPAESAWAAIPSSEAPEDPPNPYEP